MAANAAPREVRLDAEVSTSAVGLAALACQFSFLFSKEKLLRVWVCPKESKSFKCSLAFCFGIEVVKNSEWACVFCIAVIGGGFAPHISTVQNTQAHSEFLTT